MAMGRWSESVRSIDGLLGRLVFRAFGVLCAVASAVAAYGAWSHASSGRPYGWTPVILFSLIAIAFGSCVPYCFSRRRTLAEALDSMEGGSGLDINRPR